MRLLALSILLVLLALSRAAAQEEEPDVPPPPGSTEPVSDLELIRWASNEVRIHERRSLAPSAPVAPDSYIGTGVDGPLGLPREGERDALRVLAELGGGALGLLAGGGIGTLIVWGAHEAGASPTWFMIAVGAGTTIGALALTAGLVLAADAAGGRGNFGDAFIGQLVGCLAALPLVVLATADGSPELAVAALAVLPLAGAILGYEISHANGGGGPTVSLFAAPIPNGAYAGVAGEVL